MIIQRTRTPITNGQTPLIITQNTPHEKKSVIEFTILGYREQGYSRYSLFQDSKIFNYLAETQREG